MRKINKIKQFAIHVFQVSKHCLTVTSRSSTCYGKAFRGRPYDPGLRTKST